MRRGAALLEHARPSVQKLLEYHAQFRDVSRRRGSSWDLREGSHLDVLCALFAPRTCIVRSPGVALPLAMQGRQSPQIVRQQSS